MGACTRVLIVAATLVLAGCAGGNMQGTGGTGMAGGPAPKTFIVSDFVVASEVIAVDRGYTARLERKTGSFPTHERKQRTIERVNDEIVATIVAILRESGLNAQPGSEESLSFDQTVGLVTGRLHPDDSGKPNTIGFGENRGHVRATMTLSLFASGGKRELTTFTIDPASLSRSTTNAKLAAARNNSINSVVAAMGSKERLSSDVEANARRIGRVAAERIIAYAQEQAWITAPETPAVEARPERPKPVAAKPKPKPKPAAKPEEQPQEPANTQEPPQQQQQQLPKWPNT